MFRRCVSVAALFSLGCLIGCGGGSDAEGGGKHKTYPVTGSVTYNGGPLVDAIVSFAPEDKKAKLPTATDTTDNEGKFSLTTYDYDDGAAAGKFKVVITKSMVEAAGADDVPDDEHGDDDGGDASGHDSAAAKRSKSMIPETYSSYNSTPLSVEVTADGPNNFKLEIKL